MSRAPWEEGWCPNCEGRLMTDVDEDDETGDKKVRLFCENPDCGWTPDDAPDLMDLTKIHHEQEAEAP